MHLLDTLLNPFRECIASAVAEKVVVYGFSKVPSVYREQMERIIECLCLMEIEYKLRFRFTELGHLRTFCRNIRDFPKAKRLKISLVKEEGDELPDGEALAEALRALTRSRHPVRAYDNVEIDVSRVINPAAALRPMLEVSFLYLIASSVLAIRCFRYCLPTGAREDFTFSYVTFYLMGQRCTFLDNMAPLRTRIIW